MLMETQDPLMQEDLEYVANSPVVPWSQLEGSSVLVTGATGLLGSHLVRALACRNRLYNASITVYAMARNSEKAQAMFGELLQCGKISLVVGDMLGDYRLPEKIDYVIHAASETNSKAFVTVPVETIRTALYGTDKLLSNLKFVGLKGFLYLSSLEVYGTPSDGIVDIDETYSGYIDPLKVRSCYSEGKRMAECLCASYASEYGIPVKIARLTQTFDTGVTYNDGRVFAQFARCAIEGRDIVLKTKGETLRSYCYVADAVVALLTILLKGAVGEAYNVANRETAITIADMAQFVCEKFANSKSNVVYDIAESAEKLGYNPVMKISLNARKLKQLGWKPSFDLFQMFRRTIESMKGSVSQ